MIAEQVFGGIKVSGISLSGLRTCITLPEFKICFDLAQGYPFAVPMRHFFITHGHMDHAGGIPSLISQKNIGQALKPDFYLPEALVPPMQSIIGLWEKIEEHNYSYTLHGMNADSRVNLGEHHFVKPFRTLHRIPSLGYTLWEKKKKLRSDLAHLDRAALVGMKSRGEEINDHQEIPLLSFTGDTQIEFLDLSPEVKKSKVLMLEVTYYDQAKSVEHARKWGHTHLEELLPRLHELENEQIVLIHGSARYSLPQMQEWLKARVSKEDLARIVIFPGR